MRYRAQRWPCDHPVQVEGPGGRASGRIVNISPKGARLALGGAAFSPGQRVVIEMGYERLTAVVRWIRPGLMGLSFDTAISPQDLALIRGRPGAVPGGVHRTRLLGELR